MKDAHQPNGGNEVPYKKNQDARRGEECPKPGNLSLCIIITIAFMFFFSSTLLVRNGSLELSVTAHEVSRWTQIVVCFIIAIWARYVRLDAGRLFITGLGSFTLSLCLQLVFPADTISLLTGTEYPLIESIIGLCDGIQLACFSLLLAYMLCMVKPEQAIVMIPLGFAGEHGIFLLTSDVPSSYGTLLKATVIIIYISAVFVALKKVGGFSSHLEPELKHDTPLSVTPLLRVERYLPLYFGMLVFPFLYGFMAQICSLSDIESGLFSLSTEIVGIAFLLLMATIGIVRKQWIDARIGFAVLFSVFTTAFLVLPFFWTEEVFIAGFLMKCGFLIFCALMWISLQRICHHEPGSSFFYSGIAMGLFHLTLILGRRLATMLGTQMAISHDTLALISLIAVWSLSTASSLIMFLALKRKRENIGLGSGRPRIEARKNDGDREPDGSAKPSEDDVSDSAVVTRNPFDLACDCFAERYALSGREVEVLREYARGRSEATIAEAQFVSKETIKTHIKRIYAKSDCHSREDLIDRLDELSSAKFPPSRGQV